MEEAIEKLAIEKEKKKTRFVITFLVHNNKTNFNNQNILYYFIRILQFIPIEIVWKIY